MTRKSSHPAPRGENEPSASQATLPVRTDPAIDPADPDGRKKPHDGIAPRAGRTGGLGARAERPSEGSKQPVETTRQDKGGRGAKAPSACATPQGTTSARNR
jgi:hypothetical protein